MTLSDRGFRKIKAYEGYGKSLPDGGCVAYRERINGKLDIWTIGYGCTEGIDGGTRGFSCCSSDASAEPWTFDVRSLADLGIHD